jgi:aminocarboxymuconate-semialdehyde decarboxylase
MMLNGKLFREITSNSWDPDVRLGECDASEVDMQVLSTVPVMFSYWAPIGPALELSQFLNDHIADVVQAYPARFAGLGTIPLQDPDLAIRELERCVKQLGLRGVEIGSHVNHWNLSDPALFPFFEAAERLNAAIFIHPWDMIGKERMGRYWLPWLVGMPAEASLAICSLIFGGVLSKLPRLRIAVAHGGGSFPFTLGRIQHGFNVRPDLVAVDNEVSPGEYVGKFYLDTLVHDPRALNYLIDLWGEDKLAMGSDYPFPLGESRPGALIKSMPDLTETTKARLLGGTAKEWLGL